MKSKILIAAVMMAAAVAARADILATFPEVNSASFSFPGPNIVVGTDTFAPGTYTAATLSGIFGSTSDYYGSSAEFDLYINGIDVGSTYDVSPDPYNNVVPFSFSLSGAAVASLDGGSATLSVVQDTSYEIRLSGTTLDISSVPDVTGISSLVMAGLGLIGVGRRFSRKA